MVSSLVSTSLYTWQSTPMSPQPAYPYELPSTMPVAMVPVGSGMVGAVAGFPVPARAATVVPTVTSPALLGRASGKPATSTSVTVSGPVAPGVGRKLMLPALTLVVIALSAPTRTRLVGEKVKVPSVEFTVTSAPPAGVGLLTVEGRVSMTGVVTLTDVPRDSRYTELVSQQAARFSGTTPETVTNESTFGG